VDGRPAAILSSGTEKSTTAFINNCDICFGFVIREFLHLAINTDDKNEPGLVSVAGGCEYEANAPVIGSSHTVTGHLRACPVNSRG
jgi:hypothetical protein